MYLMMYNLYSVYITPISSRFGLKASAKCLNCNLILCGGDILNMKETMFVVRESNKTNVCLWKAV